MSSLSDKRGAAAVRFNPTSMAVARNRANGMKNKDNRVWGGDRHRGKLPVPENASPLVRRLFQEMNRQQVTIREVAAVSGVAAKTIAGWRRRYVPNVDNLQAAFNALDLKLAVVPMGAKT